jgi:hypothetical protein
MAMQPTDLGCLDSARPTAVVFDCAAPALIDDPCMPPVLCLSHELLQEYTPDAPALGGDVVMQGVSELATRLSANACDGVDPALPIPLPHTRQLCLLRTRLREGAAHAQHRHLSVFSVCLPVCLPVSHNFFPL